MAEGIDQRSLESGNVDEGQEKEALSQLQSELVKNNTERQGALAEERNANQMAASRLGMLRQAGTLMTSMEAPQITPNPSAGISPATAGLLNKYGYGQPGTKKSQNVVQGPQAVTVNNVTTNNVSVPPPASQPIRMSQPAGGDNTAKLKAWMEGSFQQQEAENQRREQAYSRRESALARSSSKMMRSIEKIGKSVMSSLDPTKIVQGMGDQFSVMMKLFWFTFLANNWDKILEGISGIANWVEGVWRYFTGGSEGEKSGLVKDLVTVLGGDPESETAFEAFQRLFLDEKEGLYGYIKLMFNQFFEERRLAIKQVKKPDLDNTSLLDPMHALGISLGYIGDLLAAGIGGAAGLEGSANRQITEKENIAATDVSASNQLDYYQGAENLKFANGESLGLGKGFNSISTGDASALVSARDRRAKNALLNGDITATGSLNTKDKLSGVRQSLVAYNALETGNGAGLMTALGNLDDAASTEREGVLVRRDFLERLMKSRFSDAEIDNLYRSGDIVSEAWKLVVGDNDIRDKYNVGLIGDLGQRLWGVAKGFGAGAVQILSGNTVGGQTANEGWNEMMGNTPSQLRSGQAMFATKKKLTLVPVSDPRPAVVTKETDNRGEVHFYRVKSGFFKYLKKNLGADKGFTTAGGDYTDNIEAKLFKSAGFDRRLSSNNKYSKELEAINTVKDLKKEHEKERDEYYNNSRIPKAKEGAVKVAKEKFHSAVDTGKSVVKYVNDLYGRKVARKDHATTTVTTRTKDFHEGDESSRPDMIKNTDPASGNKTHGKTGGATINASGPGTGIPSMFMKTSDDELDEEEKRKKRKKKREGSSESMEGDDSALVESQLSNMSGSGRGYTEEGNEYSMGAFGGEDGDLSGMSGIEGAKPMSSKELAAAGDRLMSKLMSLGFTKIAAAGLVGNAVNEGLAQLKEGKLYWDRTGYSGGIWGFHEVDGKGELAELFKFAANNPKYAGYTKAQILSNMDLQAEFIADRFKKIEGNLFEKLNSQTTPEGASRMVANHYERFAGFKDQNGKEHLERISATRDVYERRGAYKELDKKRGAASEGTSMRNGGTDAPIKLMKVKDEKGKWRTVGADYSEEKYGKGLAGISKYWKESKDWQKFAKWKDSSDNKTSSAYVKASDGSTVDIRSKHTKEAQAAARGEKTTTSQPAPANNNGNKTTTPAPAQGQQQGQQQAEGTDQNAAVADASINSLSGTGSSGGVWLNNYDPTGSISVYKSMTPIHKPKIDYSRLIKPRKKTDPIFNQMNQMILEIRAYTEATMHNTANQVEGVNYTNIALGGIYKKLGGAVTDGPGDQTASMTPA